MFKIAVVLSTIPAFNVFRSTLSGAFATGYLDQFLICSGFFHQRHNKRGRFFASDAFLNSALPPASAITVVGAYDPASNEFDDFVTTLRSGLRTTSGSPVPITQRRSLRKYGNRWHAKVFVAREGNHERLAVVGSSNLTRSAFDTSATNNEADVVIWDDEHEPTKQLVGAALSRPDEAPGNDVANPTVIVSTYDADDPRNSPGGPMPGRLGQLWRDILSATV